MISYKDKYCSSKNSTCDTYKSKSYITDSINTRCSSDIFYKKYCKYKMKYLNLKESNMNFIKKKLIGGSDTQILGFSTVDLDIFNNLNCEQIMDLSKTSKSFNILVKNNISDIYKLNKKIDKNFYPKKIENDYSQFVNICMYDKIKKTMNDLEMYSFERIKNYEELILLTEHFGINNLFRFIKLSEYFNGYSEYMIQYIFGVTTSDYYFSDKYRYSIESKNFLTNDIIKNIIKLLKNGFYVPDAIQFSFVSIPRTDEEIREIISAYQDRKLDLKNIVYNSDEDADISPENKIELERLLESKTINSIIFDSISNKRLDDWTSKNIRFKHYGKNNIISEEIVNNFILLHDLKDLGINDLLNLSYNIIARTDEEIDKLIEFNKLEITSNIDRFLALKNINLDNFKELKSININTHNSILASNLDNIEVVKQLKIGQFMDQYCYLIAKNKNGIVRLVDLIRLNEIGILSERDIYKVSMFYLKQEQVNNLIKLCENNLKNYFIYDIPKILDNTEIDIFLELINVNRYYIEKDFLEIEEEDNDYDEIFQDELKDFEDNNLLNIYCQAVKTFTPEQIKLMKELLQLRFYPEIAYIASKNFKNEVQKNMIISLKNADLRNYDSYRGALVLTTLQQKNKYIERMLNFYHNGSENIPALNEIEDILYSQVPIQREPTYDDFRESPIEKKIRIDIKKIFIEDLLFKLLNPGAISDYNRFARELGYLN